MTVNVVSKSVSAICIQKGPKNTYQTIFTLSDNEIPGRWIVFGVTPITIACVIFLEVFGQLLWFLHTFLLSEARNGIKT